MIDLYAWMTPNGFKITIALEEMAVPYTLKPIDIGERENKDAAFTALTPNQKIPVIVDHAPTRGAPITLWESGAILIYLAEKYKQFLPKSGANRARVLQWLMFQMAGIGPNFGNAFHFQKATKGAMQKTSYGTERFMTEAQRLCGVLDGHLADQTYLGGSSYSIADIATYPWIRSLQPLSIPLDPYLHLKRWFHGVEARPAVQKGMEAFKALGLPKPKEGPKPQACSIGGGPAKTGTSPKGASAPSPKPDPKSSPTKKAMEKAILDKILNGKKTT